MSTCLLLCFFVVLLLLYWLYICVYVVPCCFFWDGSIMLFGLDQLENPVGTGMLFFFNSYDYDRGA